MLPIREIQKNNEKTNFERTFLIEENIVSDNDILPPDIENWKNKLRTIKRNDKSERKNDKSFNNRRWFTIF